MGLHHDHRGHRGQLVPECHHDDADVTDADVTDGDDEGYLCRDAMAFRTVLVTHLLKRLSPYCITFCKIACSEISSTQEQ